MLQPAERLRFLLEPAQQFRAGKPGLDDFQRDGAAGLVLFRLVDGAHAAFADQAQDAIAPDRLRQRPELLPHRPLKDPFALGRLHQQGFHVPLQLVIALAHFGEERAAVTRLALQCALTEALHALPALGGHGVWARL